MTSSDPIPSRFDQRLDAVDRMEDLPQSRAFEQVMYDNLSSRITRFASDKPVVFEPRLIQSAFPEALRDQLVFSADALLVLSNLKIVQLLQPVETGDNDSREESAYRRQAKATFEANGTDFTFFTDGTNAVLSIEGINGKRGEVNLGDDSFTAFLASILYAMQYDESAPLVPFELQDDPILVRKSPNGQSTESESFVERMLMTMGDLDGQAETITLSIFDTGTKLLSATLLTSENPRLSGVNSTMELNEVGGFGALSSAVYQNEANRPIRLYNHYAELRESNMFDLFDSKVELVEPDKDPERWAGLCVEFNGHVAPLMLPYEELEEQLEHQDIDDLN